MGDARFCQNARIGKNVQQKQKLGGLVGAVLLIAQKFFWSPS